jgi:hypothetical protein
MRLSLGKENHTPLGKSEKKEIVEKISALNAGFNHIT